jgi:hypothetical protein
VGLDWNPMARARPGHERELTELLAELDDLPEDARERSIARFREISIPPFETVGAPRVGHDAAADAWLLDQLREQGREGEIDAAKAAMKGYWVLDLVPASPGFPVYSSSGYEGVDRYTFRGKFLDDTESIIGSELLERAYEKMDAPGLLAYGTTHLEIARTYAREHGVAHLEEQRDPPDDASDDSPGFKAHVIFSAARWCTWWAERGHGLEPYF